MILTVLILTQYDLQWRQRLLRITNSQARLDRNYSSFCQLCWCCNRCPKKSLEFEMPSMDKFAWSRATYTDTIVVLIVCQAWSWINSVADQLTFSMFSWILIERNSSFSMSPIKNYSIKATIVINLVLILGTFSQS